MGSLITIIYNNLKNYQCSSKEQPKSYLLTPPPRNACGSVQAEKTSHNIKLVNLLLFTLLKQLR